MNPHEYSGLRVVREYGQLTLENSSQDGEILRYEVTFEPPCQPGESFAWRLPVSSQAGLLEVQWSVKW